MTIYKLNLFVFDYAGDATTSPGMNAEMREFYNTQLFKDAEPNLVYDQFADQYDIPHGNGKTILFRKVDPLPKATTPLVEGVTPDPTHLNVIEFSATVSQFGRYIQRSDMLSLTTIDPIVSESISLLSNQAARTINALTRDEICGGLNVFYGGGKVSRADITSADVLTCDMVLDIVAELEAVNAPKIDGYYVCVCHPYVLRDVMKSDDWKDAQKYTDPNPIFKGAIGEYGGVKFIGSSESKIWGPGEIAGGFERLTVSKANSSASTSVEVAETLPAESMDVEVYINGVANAIKGAARIPGQTSGTVLTVETGVTCAVGNVVCGAEAGKDGSAVFGVMFFGKGAYGKTKLSGGGLESIVKPLGYGDDPLNQRASVGWKCTHVAKRLNELYMVRAEVGSASSASALSN